MLILLLIVFALVSPNYGLHQCRKGSIEGKTISIKNVKCESGEDTCRKVFFDFENKEGVRRTIAYFGCEKSADCKKIGECYDITKGSRVSPNNAEYIIHTAVKCCDNVFIK